MKKQDRRESADYQRAVGQLVEREVVYCVSGLVAEIGKEKPDEWLHLFTQDDWETPASEAIADFSRQQLEEFLAKHGHAADAGNTDAVLVNAYLRQLKDGDDLREFCEENDLEPHNTEIYEHWIVSNWLAAQLEQRGEVIERDFYGLTIWGRSCTGQSILLDGVMCAIYDELHKDEKTETRT